MCDQARRIRKNKSITKLELENIRRKVIQREKDIEFNNNDNTGKRFYQGEENIHENEARVFDTENLGEMIIIQYIDLMKDDSRMELREFNKIQMCTCRMVKEDKLYIEAYQN